MLAAICALTARALGAVVAVDASVVTAVQELIDGQPASVNADDDSRNADGSNLPLLAAADVVSTDLEGSLVAHGRGFATFADPTRLDQPNPEELALETACFSNAESVSYLVTATAAETRTLRFARSEVAFASDGTRDVESVIFVSGAIVLWSAEPGGESDQGGSGHGDLGGMSSEISFVVSRGGGVEAPLFQTSLVVQGDDQGGVASEADGPIEFEAIGLNELADRGVDEATIDILQQVADQGVLMVLAIPRQEHIYRYVVGANEPFELSAKLEARIRNAPNGTGVAVAMGRPFSELANFIEQGLPGVKGGSLQRAVNDSVAARVGGNRMPSDGTARDVPRWTPCGALGGEALLMVLMPLTMVPGIRPARAPGSKKSANGSERTSR
ncbi:MAG: hypothetical protein Q7R41_16190 [Phycisphaerales bacterium]|nr:hypothetical protein [Phycisphaerales bacterium]